MKRFCVIVGFGVLSCLIAAVYPGPVEGAEKRRTLAWETFRDRLRGGWAGQMIGVRYGAPTEFRYRGKTIDGEIQAWTPDRIRNSLNQDDLYVDMTFAQVLDDKGVGATTEDFGRMFRDSQYALWHANLAARRNLLRGVPANLAGDPRYNAHSDDIDFQIESDFIGLMSPGLPITTPPSSRARVP